ASALTDKLSRLVKEMRGQARITDLDRLLQLGEDRIEIVRLEAAGCYGRNCADDVCADAALLSMAVGAHVRVQLTRARLDGAELLPFRPMRPVPPTARG